MDKLKHYAVAAVCGVLALSGWILPGALSLKRGLSIDGQCEPAGLTGKIREAIHGREFWAAQIPFIDADIRDLDYSADSAIEMRKRMESYAEERYALHPQTRPTPNEKRVQELRDMADDLEARENYALTEPYRKARLERLRACREIAVKQAAER